MSASPETSARERVAAGDGADAARDNDACAPASQGGESRRRRMSVGAKSWDETLADGSLNYNSYAAMTRKAPT